MYSRKKSILLDSVIIFIVRQPFELKSHAKFMMCASFSNITLPMFIFWKIAIACSNRGDRYITDFNGFSFSTLTKNPSWFFLISPLSRQASSCVEAHFSIFKIHGCEIQDVSTSISIEPWIEQRSDEEEEEDGDESDKHL